jgi:hypothetical protein
MQTWNAATATDSPLTAPHTVLVRLLASRSLPLSVNPSLKFKTSQLERQSPNF